MKGWTFPFESRRINDMDIYVGSRAAMAFDMSVYGKRNFGNFAIVFWTVIVNVYIRHNDRHHYLIVLQRHNKKCLCYNLMNNYESSLFFKFKKYFFFLFNLWKFHFEGIQVCSIVLVWLNAILRKFMKMPNLILIYTLPKERID